MIQRRASLSHDNSRDSGNAGDTTCSPAALQDQTTIMTCVWSKGQLGVAYYDQMLEKVTDALDTLPKLLPQIGQYVRTLATG